MNIKLMPADENEHLLPGGTTGSPGFCSEQQPKNDCLTEIRCSNPTLHFMRSYWNSKSDSHFKIWNRGTGATGPISHQPWRKKEIDGQPMWEKWWSFYNSYLELNFLFR